MYETDERTDEASTPDVTKGDRSVEGASSTSRRNFLRAGAATGALALGLGATVNPASAAKVEETCSTSSRGDFGKIDVGGNWTIMDNQWSRPNNRQCVWLNEDGSFGWDFDASTGTNAGPNYPEAYAGTRPWGEDTGASGFPVRRRDIDEFTVDLNATTTVGGGEYDFALEWWLSQSQPGGGTTVTSSTTHEVMLLFDWGGGHIGNHGGYNRRNAFSGSEGHSFNVLQEAGTGGVEGADFWIFTLESPSYNTTVDLSAIVDYMSQNGGASGNLWLSGVEIGNEYWAGVSGETTFTHLQTTINGQTHSAGSGGGRETTTTTTTTTERTTTTTRTTNVPRGEDTPGRVGPNGNLPSDPDDDGLYEDVNGNTRQDIADAVDLFQHRNEVDAEFFDFNESGGMSIGDAVSLFRENT